jgi:predicted metal-dependent hydrolase
MNPLRFLAGLPRAPVRTVARDSISLTLENGHTVELLRVRDPRARRMKLSVSERGARLTLPLRASDRAGERFVQEHAAWLMAQLAHNDAPVGELQPHVTDRLPLRGVQVPVTWREGRALRLVMDEGCADAGAANANMHGTLHITVPPAVRPDSLRRALRDFLEAQARADVGRWLPRYLPDLPRAPARLRLRMMSSQWGSLSPDGSLCLDLALVLATPAAFEYVLVHELCHLIHPDHSRSFWREVEARCPGWHTQREYFREEGRRLKATLHGLCGQAR